MTDQNPPLPLQALEQGAECLRIISHPARLRMIELALAARHTVGELAEACGIPPSAASDHLRMMGRCGLFRKERAGRCVYYRVAQPQLAGIIACIRSRFG